MQNNYDKNINLLLKQLNNAMEFHRYMSPILLPFRDSDFGKISTPMTDLSLLDAYELSKKHLIISDVALRYAKQTSRTGIADKKILEEDYNYMTLAPIPTLIDFRGLIPIKVGNAIVMLHYTYQGPNNGRRINPELSDDHPLNTNNMIPVGVNIFTLSEDNYYHLTELSFYDLSHEELTLFLNDEEVNYHHLRVCLEVVASKGLEPI